jgi:hypothetical protein
VTNAWPCIASHACSAMAIHPRAGCRPCSMLVTTLLSLNGGAGRLPWPQTVLDVDSCSPGELGDAAREIQQCEASGSGKGVVSVIGIGNDSPNLKRQEILPIFRKNFLYIFSSILRK